MAGGWPFKKALPLAFWQVRVRARYVVSNSAPSDASQSFSKYVQSLLESTQKSRDIVTRPEEGILLGWTDVFYVWDVTSDYGKIQMTWPVSSNDIEGNTLFTGPWGHQMTFLFFRIHFRAGIGDQCNRRNYYNRNFKWIQNTISNIIAPMTKANWKCQLIRASRIGHIYKNSVSICNALVYAFSMTTVKAFLAGAGGAWNPPF